MALDTRNQYHTQVFLDCVCMYLQFDQLVPCHSRNANSEGLDVCSDFTSAVKEIAIVDWSGGCCGPLGTKTRKGLNPADAQEQRLIASFRLGTHQACHANEKGL